MREAPVVAVSKVAKNGVVQIPHEVIAKLDLRPGTKLILMEVDGMVVLRKADAVFERREQPGLLDRLRSVFSGMPIRDIEE
jgi:AbrB family looped-hinge helix DNA binding protein